VASPTPAYESRQEAQTNMVTKAQAERMLSEEERALLVQCARGPDAYPVVELGGKWTWEFGPLGAPESYDTKAEAVHNLELLLGVLREAARVESERRYGDRDSSLEQLRAIADQIAPHMRESGDD
jgi:hypothetical protein